MTTLIQSVGNAVKHWYIFLFIGIILVVCGIYIFTVPLETFLTLSVLFSVSFIVNGVSQVFFSVQNRQMKGWGWYLTGGIFDLLIGVYLITVPVASAAILPYVVGFTMLFRSFQGLGSAFDLKDLGVTSWGGVALASVLGIIVSFIFLGNPAIAGLSLVTFAALSIIFAGISAIVLAFGLKKL